ncbi:TonB C-terminal domain-containing protein [Acidipila sp. EB88]|nr:TonB C-terminal domain-containing protein [Acidipila sp. EB88]
MQLEQSNTAATPAPLLAVEVLSDTQGLDFNPYMKSLTTSLKPTWQDTLAKAAIPLPDFTGTAVGIRFTVKHDGSVDRLRITSPSGSVAFDRAAWNALLQSAPMPPLPAAFTAAGLELQIRFTAAARSAGSR